MREKYYFESVDQIKAIGDSLRMRLLNILIEKPMTGSQLARKLSLTRQKVHYHLNVLKDAGLIVVQKEGRVKGLREVYYRAIARAFFTPDRSPSGHSNRTMAAEAYNSVLFSFLNQVQVDLQQELSDEENALVRGVQETVNLTPAQLLELRKYMSEITRKARDLETQNEQQGLSSLQPMRITLFYMPVRRPASPQTE